MLARMTLEDALARIEGEQVRSDRIVPAQRKDPGHSPYRPGYEWLFFYERSLARFLDPWLEGKRPALFGPAGIICEALSNAYCHGNQRDSRRAITVEVYAGDRGILVQINDDGAGFEVETVLRARERKQPYFHIAGNGLRRMDEEQDFTVFFTNNGTACNILYIADEVILEKITE